MIGIHDLDCKGSSAVATKLALFPTTGDGPSCPGKTFSHGLEAVVTTGSCGNGRGHPTTDPKAEKFTFREAIWRLDGVGCVADRIVEVANGSRGPKNPEKRPKM